MKKRVGIGVLLGLLLCLGLGCAAGAEGAPRISELMASNGGTLVDASGGTPDWIELYNPTDGPLSLEGLCLSDGRKNLEKFRFPQGAVMEPGAYLLVYASGREETAGAEWHAAFKLSADGETVYLSRSGEILEAVTFPALGTDLSYALGEDGAFQVSYQPTPGAANVIAEAAAPAQAFTPEGLRLSEILTSNAIVKGGNSFDFIELHNPTSQGIALAGYTLSLSPSKTFTFPARTSIGAGGYVLVHCTDENAGTDKGNTYYAPFTIPAQNATVTLTNPEGEVVDRVTLADQFGNVSYGRPLGGDAFGYLEEPTPGRANQETAYAARFAPPVLDLPGGFYEGPVRVTVTAPEGAELRYSLDGSTPGAGSELLVGPVEFAETGVLRVRAVSGEALASQVVTATYFIGLDVPAPVVSLATDNAYLFARDTGLMVSGSGSVPNYKRGWEYPIHIEYYDETGKQWLDQMCGFRIVGEISRLHSQKGMGFYARNGYGQGSFDFEPFENRDFGSYESFVLRSAGSEGAGNGVRFRDAMLTSLGEGTHVLVQAARPVLVFMNGRCWGHYNVREKINRDFIAQHEGITDPDEISKIDLLERTGSVIQGSNTDYKELISFIKSHDLNDPDHLEHVLSQMDVDSYFDHLILEIVTGNEDIDNYKFYRVPGGKWKWIFYDLDTALGRLSDIPLSYLMEDKKAPPTHGFDHAPFAALMEVPEMRDKFLTRMGQLMVEKFVYADLAARAEQWRQDLTPLMPYQMERWGKLTWPNWEAALKKLDTFLRDRPPVVVEHMRASFRLTDEEVERYFGAYLDTLE